MTRLAFALTFVAGAAVMLAYMAWAAIHGHDDRPYLAPDHRAALDGSWWW